MDANTIRLILIVVGTLLILLLYLWERHRAREEDFEDEDEDEEDVETGDDDAPYGTSVWRQLKPTPDEADAKSREPGGGRSPAPPSSQTREVSAPVGNKATPPAKTGATAPASAPASRLAPLLIQVSVTARGQPFQGAKILEVTESCGLHPGKMDIFHSLADFDDETRGYFSMANMVKPGTFSFADMEHFSTPGLMLFAQLEGDPEDMTVLDELLATARKLAQALDGDVLDDTRHSLTVKKQDAMRQAVLNRQLRGSGAERR